MKRFRFKADSLLQLSGTVYRQTDIPSYTLIQSFNTQPMDDNYLEQYTEYSSNTTVTVLLPHKALYCSMYSRVE